jgi:hypothetical protein
MLDVAIQWKASHQFLLNHLLMILCTLVEPPKLTGLMTRGTFRVRVVNPGHGEMRACWFIWLLLH